MDRPAPAGPVRRMIRILSGFGIIFGLFTGWAIYTTWDTRWSEWSDAARFLPLAALAVFLATFVRRVA